MWVDIPKRGAREKKKEEKKMKEEMNYYFPFH